jgi:hypothetical protein
MNTTVQLTEEELLLIETRRNIQAAEAEKAEAEKQVKHSTAIAKKREEIEQHKAAAKLQHIAAQAYFEKLHALSLYYTYVVLQDTKEFYCTEYANGTQDKYFSESVITDVCKIVYKSALVEKAVCVMKHYTNSSMYRTVDNGYKMYIMLDKGHYCKDPKNPQSSTNASKLTSTKNCLRQLLQSTKMQPMSKA